MLKEIDTDQRCTIQGVSLHIRSWDQCLATVRVWARRRESRYVCFCNVHSVVTASSDAVLHGALAGADLALSDGAPVAWLMRACGGAPAQQRIAGPDFMWACLEAAEKDGLIVSFYGASESTLEQLRAVLQSRFPALKTGCWISPPYRVLTPQEQSAYVEQINASGSAILFVGLGCPKQEIWMAQRRGALSSVMLGVGAAFDFHAGTVRRAPEWIRLRGLEWAYRLCSEPRRLWRRYLITNTLFMYRAARALFSHA